MVHRFCKARLGNLLILTLDCTSALTQYSGWCISSTLKTSALRSSFAYLAGGPLWVLALEEQM